MRSILLADSARLLAVQRGTSRTPTYFGTFNQPNPNKAAIDPSNYISFRSKPKVLIKRNHFHGDPGFHLPQRPIEMSASNGLDGNVLFHGKHGSFLANIDAFGSRKSHRLRIQRVSGRFSRRGANPTLEARSSMSTSGSQAILRVEIRKISLRDATSGGPT